MRMQGDLDKWKTWHLKSSEDLGGAKSWYVSDGVG